MSKVRTNRSEMATVRALRDAIARGRLTRREAILRGGALGLSLPAMIALHGATGGVGALAA